MDANTTDAATILPKVPRPPRTKARKKASADASRRHREKRKAAGVPTSAQIDAALAKALVGAMMRGSGMRLTADHLPNLRNLVCRRMGWDQETELVVGALDARVDALLRQGWPVPVARPSAASGDDTTD